MKRIPPYRKLRGYAFDPSLSLRLDTVGINEMVYMVPWEDFDKVRADCQNSSGKSLPTKEEALIGEYLEILDYDPTVERFYRALNLDDPYLLAQDGLDPSEANPQFHQQMVYAVAMTTIMNFERALGRKVQWAPRRYPKPTGKTKDGEQLPWPKDAFVPRLRIYPHALREANAYYSPQKKAILMGYFSSTPADASVGMRGNLVFTCLSHDIVAHEVTHAILDGMFPYYNEPTNPDVLAFHEAFADIVALFQHFSFPDVLRHQIAKTRGDLKTENLLGQLAQEFGRGIGQRGSLRDAIGERDEQTNTWRPHEPSPLDYQQLTEPHDRGCLLVAAIFEAFTNIYQFRTADLIRIATGGSGILPQGALHPDLVNRLSDEASKVAGQVLAICIRAMDYCPPVDITFGDYLRAIVTADIDLVPYDNRNYRVAFIEAFRRRGIYPQGIKTLSEESLRYKLKPVMSGSKEEFMFSIIGKFLLEYREAVVNTKTREELSEINQDFITMGQKKNSWQREGMGLHERLTNKFQESPLFESLTGLVMRRDSKIPKTFGVKTKDDLPKFRVADLRLVSRTSPTGRQINQVVFSILQRAVAVYDPIKHTFSMQAPDDEQDFPENSILLRGGCTIIFDLDSQSVKHIITKPILEFNTSPGTPIKASDAAPAQNRIRQQYHYQYVEGPNAFSNYHRFFMGGFHLAALEPFSLVHQH